VNEIKVVGLGKVKVVPATIECNLDEMENALEIIENQLKNEIITEDSIQMAKTTMSDLNKLRKKIKTSVKESVDEAMKNIEPFKARNKSFDTKLEEIRNILADQVAWFGYVESAYKYDIALMLIEQTKHEVELNEKYLPLIIVEDDYLLAASNPTKVKKLSVANFFAAKTLQDAEQMKIDTIHMVIDAHNSRLRFKFSFEDFERFINDETSLKELNKIVNDKVNSRLEDEAAELVRIKIEQEAAVKAAEAKVKADAEALALKVKQEAEAEALKVKQDAEQAIIDAENAHKEELRQAEVRKAAELRKLEREKDQVIEVVTDQIDLIVPEEVKEDEPVQEFCLEVKGTEGQIEALKNYLNQYGYDWSEFL